MTALHYVAAWAVISTVVPLLLLMRRWRASHRQFQKNANALLLRIGSLSVRIGSSGPAVGQFSPLDPATVSLFRARVDQCKIAISSARKRRFFHPVLAAEALGRVDGVLDILSALVSLRDDASSRSSDALRRAMSETFVFERDALLRRITVLEKEGVPLGAERQLVERSNAEYALASRASWIDPLRPLSSFGAHCRRLAEIDAHVSVRERAWRSVENEAVVAESALRAASEAIASLDAIASDPASAETARGLQAKRSVSRVRALISEATTRIGLARRNCHPGDGAFTTPGADVDRLLLASRTCAVALSIARVAQQTAVRHRDAQSAAASRRGQA